MRNLLLNLTVFSNRHLFKYPSFLSPLTSKFLTTSSIHLSLPQEQQSSVQQFMFKKVNGSIIPHRLPETSIIISFDEKLKFKEIIPFQDKENLWWKSRFVQAFLQSFQTGELMGILELDKSVFYKYPLRPDLIKEALTYERSWLEQGTEFSRPLGMMRGSNRKSRPQKGTGRSRQGSIRKPQFRGGYRPHGPRPHDKSIDINEPVYHHAIRHAISTKFAQDQLMIVDDLSLTEPSSQVLFNFLSKKYQEIFGETEDNEDAVIESTESRHTSVSNSSNPDSSSSDQELVKADDSLEETDLKMEQNTEMLRAVYEEKDGLFLEEIDILMDKLKKDYQKQELISRLKNLNLYGRRVYFLYGNPEAQAELIRAGDLLEDQRKNSDNIWGEKENIICDARNISILPLMKCEMLVMDKTAAEVLEGTYRK